MTDKDVNPEQTKETARKLEAEARKAEAEARKVELETLFLESEETRKQELHTVMLRNNELATSDAEKKLRLNEIHLAREMRKENALLADDTYNRVFTFDQPVSSVSVEACISTLTQWMRNEPGKDIEIIFDSPGGSVIDGMHLWDFLSYIKGRGHHVTTVALGMAASMAGILLQAGTKRVLGRESYILIHQISFVAAGKMGEIEDEVAFSKKIQGRILDIFAERSAHTLIERGDPTPLPKLIKARRDFFARGWNRKDWWLDSDEAMREGLIDEVR